MITKSVEGFLIVDWKTGNMRVRKKMDSRIKGNEIPIRISVNLEIPEKPTPSCEISIRLSDTKVAQIVGEEI